MIKDSSSKTNKITKHKVTQVEHHLSFRMGNRRYGFGFIDHLVIFSGPLIPIAVFIQAYNIWILDRGQGLSIYTWSILLFASITMAVYSIYHHIKPLMITYLPLVFANSLVVAGIVLNN